MNKNLSTLSSILSSKRFQDDFQLWSLKIADYIIETKSVNKLISIFGNGGSAADSQHWAAELACTYKDRARAPYPAISLTTDTSIITAWSNDFNFTSVFKRQIEAFGLLNGLSIGLSTSGRSINVLSALAKSSEMGAKTVLISGSASDSYFNFDLHVSLPSSETPIVQTLTQMLYHEVCQHLEES